VLKETELCVVDAKRRLDGFLQDLESVVDEHAEVHITTRKCAWMWHTVCFALSLTPRLPVSAVQLVCTHASRSPPPAPLLLAQALGENADLLEAKKLLEANPPPSN
jgi:hypothetical protein